MAFHRNGAGRSAIFVVPIGGGEPRIVGDWVSGMIGGLTWASDGREIIYTRPETSLAEWYGRHSMLHDPTPVNGVPFGATGPTVSRVSDGSTYRLGFATGQVDIGLRLIDLAAAPEGQPLGHTAFADATRMDSPGRFSPDGSQVAFASDRGGSPQVWVAARDGSALRSLTRLESATLNVGSWSPDGQWVAFDATVAGRTDLYVVRTDGGVLKRLTEGPAIEVDPEWSRDGAWIYYSSNESGAQTIWKMPAQGGRPCRSPRRSASSRACRLTVGRVYFVDQRKFSRMTLATLKQVSSDGGTASVVLSNLAPGAWDVTDSGIVFLASRAAGNRRPRRRHALRLRRGPDASDRHRGLSCRACLREPLPDRVP